MGFLVLLLVNVALAGITAALQARSRSKIKAQPFDIPEMKLGDPVPVVFGTAKVPIRVIEYDGYRTTDINDGPRPFFNAIGARATTGRRYHVDMTGLVCCGPVDTLMDLYFDNKSLRAQGPQRIVTGLSGSFKPVYTEYQTLPPPIDFSEYWLQGHGTQTAEAIGPWILGGKDGNGGIRGFFTWKNGYGYAFKSSYLVNRTPMGAEVPDWRHYAYLVFHDFWVGNSPVLPPIHALVRRIPQQPFGATMLGDASAAPHDANPFACIYELLTHPYHGLGIPPELLNLDSFWSAATFSSDGESGVGVSFALEEYASAREVISDLLRTADGSLYTDPGTGKLTVYVHRSPEQSGFFLSPFYLTPDTVQSVEWTAPVAAAAINTVQVTFNERTRSYRSESVTAENTALVAAMGQRVVQEVQFLGVTTEAMARRLAMRELRALTVPLAKAKIVCDRYAAQLHPGKHFALTWPELGLDEFIMRVVDIDFGTVENPVVTIDAVQDHYAMPGDADTATTGIEPWVPTTPVGGARDPDVDSHIVLGKTTATIHWAIDDVHEQGASFQATVMVNNEVVGLHDIDVEDPQLTIALDRDRETSVEYVFTFNSFSTGLPQEIRDTIVLPKGTFPNPPRIVMEAVPADPSVYPKHWVAHIYPTDETSDTIYALVTETVYDDPEDLVADAIAADDPGVLDAVLPIGLVGGVRKATQAPPPSDDFGPSETLRYTVAAVSQDDEGNVSAVTYQSATALLQVVGPGNLAESLQEFDANIIVDGGGGVPALGMKCDFRVPCKCEPVGWTVVADGIGPVTFDLWSDTFGNYPPTIADTIVGTDPPVLGLGAVKASSTAMTDWPATLNKGDILRVILDEVGATIRHITLILTFRRVE